ncbi:MAG: 50S ribosomal protein L23 [Chloroflexi bacterium]|nr:50S ribosomal protein L23 [Chloroflexota bacterium]
MPLYEVLRRPIITEKNTMLQAQDKYTFEVASGANKHQVKQAVEKAFNVHVRAVNVMWVRGKTRRMGRSVGRTPDWKKAVVTIASGDKIELFENI